MKADDYCKLARELLEKPPLRSTIWKDMPPEEEGAADEQDIVFEILRRLMNEVKPLCLARKVSTDQGILGIMKELRQKWFAICDRMDHPSFQKPSFDAFLKVLDEKTSRASRSQPRSGKSEGQSRDHAVKDEGQSPRDYAW